MKSKPQKYIETELGKEKLCIHCSEYWPLDSEFWYFSNSTSKDGTKVRRYEAACKCCYIARYKPARLKAPRKEIKSNHERVAA